MNKDQLKAMAEEFLPKLSTPTALKEMIEQSGEISWLTAEAIWFDAFANGCREVEPFKVSALPIPLEQIKPVVIGYRKIKPNGIRSSVFWLKDELTLASNLPYHLHKNGKPKFRPVYDYGVKS